MRSKKIYRWMNDIVLFLFMTGILAIHIILYNNNAFLSIVLFIISAVITIHLFKKYTSAYKISKDNLNRKNVYHLLNKDKLDKITKGKIKNLYQVKLSRTKGILNNYSGKGRRFTYFHTDFKEYSYFYNHFLKKYQPEYMLIVPIKNLDERYLFARNIDNALLYAADYEGTAKVVKVSKMKFVNKITRNSCKLFIIDTFICFLLGNTIMHFIAIFFRNVGII